MPDQRGWPDPAKPGVPPNPDQEGPHLIKDERGVRRWYFWVPSRTSWFSAFYERHQLYAGEHWTYIGAAIKPDEPDIFQRQAGQPAGKITPVRHMRRRFPPPWSVTRTTGGWQVVDADGLAVAYTCGDDTPQGASSRQMTVDEARRVAANIAKLPELLKPRR